MLEFSIISVGSITQNESQPEDEIARNVPRGFSLDNTAVASSAQNIDFTKLDYPAGIAIKITIAAGKYNAGD